MTGSAGAAHALFVPGPGLGSAQPLPPVPGLRPRPGHADQPIPPDLPVLRQPGPDEPVRAACDRPAYHQKPASSRILPDPTVASMAAGAKWPGGSAQPGFRAGISGAAEISPTLTSRSCQAGHGRLQLTAACCIFGAKPVLNAPPPQLHIPVASRADQCRYGRHFEVVQDAASTGISPIRGRL